jgi:hypothetical protein
MKNNLTKQYHIKYIGTFIHIIYTTLPIFSVVSNILAAATWFGVWRSGLLIYAPWLTLPIFFVMLICLALVTIFLVYKFIYPSYFSFQNTQQFPEDGQLAKMIRKIVREELDKK